MDHNDDDDDDGIKFYSTNDCGAMIACAYDCLCFTAEMSPEKMSIV